MANIILFDSDARNHLLPLTATRPMGELRIGILTLREKWERRLHGTVSYITQEYLQDKYPINIEEDNFIVNAGVLPTPALCSAIDNLAVGEALLKAGELIAGRLNERQFELLIEDEELDEMQGDEIPEQIQISQVNRLWDLIYLNEQELEADFRLLCDGRQSQPLSETVQVIGDRSLVFLEPGARIECCTLNTRKGPIYIGKDAEVMEGCFLRGPIGIGAGAVLKMGAKIYGPTSIGPVCRAGGEITRSIMLANANKGHEGYLGDSVLGEWCNIGADSNNSNLKNNYAEVKLWDYETGRFEKTGHQFVGLFMGDHAKCGINTMFNTGTVVGIFANVYGAGYQRNFVPDFAWGGADSAYRTYKFAEAMETAGTVMKRRGIPFTDLEKAILYHVYDQTATYRSWEK
jgi:UDP-N-acetylglucosamine diphosphorylase/glucosamine-1-phosphate N-acetyltransferase